MRKNKSTPKNDFLVNRQNLINKISDALSIKYGNFFTVAKYDTKTLKEDIGKLISTQYYSKDPRDVFKPIESNILEIVKQKNPNLQIKVKKARKLPEIKYTKDKYQEADQLEREIEDNSKPLTMRKTKTPNQRNILSKKPSNKAINKNKNAKATNNAKQMPQINNNENKKEEIINSLYKLKDESNIKHTLVDQLNYKIKNDPTIKYLNEEKKLYEKEKEEKKQKKILEQNKYLNYLKSQIEERDKVKEKEKKK